MARGVWELRESFSPRDVKRRGNNNSKQFGDFYDFKRVRKYDGICTNRCLSRAAVHTECKSDHLSFDKWPLFYDGWTESLTLHV